MKTKPPSLMNRVCTILGRRSWMVLWTAAIVHLSRAEETVPIRINHLFPMESLDVMFDPPEPRDGIVFCSWSRGPSPETMKEIGTRFRPPINGSARGPKYTDREDIFLNCSLSINNLTFEHSGNYLLIEGGPQQMIVGYASITVVDFLPKPNVIAIPSNTTVELVPVRLFCNATKGLMITWFKDGKPYTKEHNESLDIPSVNRSDAGGYQCQITNHTSTRISDVLYLNVVYGPDTPEIQPTQRYYKEDADVVLTCHADSYPQKYVWFHNGKEVDTGPKLFLQNFTENQTGSYICQVENELLHKKLNSSSLEIYLEKSRVRNITVTGPPNAIEGRLISLNCTSKGDNVSYSWTKQGQVVGPDSHISLKNNDQTLEFNPGHRNDTADYICHGSNSISFNESKPYRLEIIYGPDIPVINETIDIPNALVKLSCRAVVSPSAVYTWFYKGEQRDDSILLQKWSPENSGNYTCSVTNPISSLERNTTLQINMKKKLKSLK